ncbi:hypothetical protein C8A01DRAFT_39733 [Parachaetomium inaequale]|uniref:Uncharacterized protein n=1 Tax=Parachaetomium inaequale TaxID=2588326 RepID=A0AAN6P8Q8_9PEZI|nr:hypothetical protein C8A01DRAFT_39733 [Parachaetomium inaequale]
MELAFHRAPCNDTGYRFDIGIDFGATCSGVTVKITDKTNGPGPYQSVASWPQPSAGHHPPATACKTPTRLSLSSPSLGTSEPVLWGSQVPDDGESLRWFKLGLVHEDDLAEDPFDGFLQDVQESTELDDAKTLRRQHHTTATKVCKVYLSKLASHVLEYIALKTGLTMAQVLASELHFVVGVPANWQTATLARL